MNKQGQASICCKTSGQPPHTSSITFFDILIHRGKDVKRLPLSKRRAILAKALTPSDHVGLSRVAEITATQMIDFMRLHGLEGVVAKRADTVYQPGKRTGYWTKTRINLAQEFVIGGYMPRNLGVNSIVVGSTRARPFLRSASAGQFIMASGYSERRFPGAGVAGENRRAVGRDIELSNSEIQQAMKVFQADDDFVPLVGQPDALHFGIRTSGREAEIPAVRGCHIVHDEA
jgi:ATP dependent DNA ligase domain